MSFTVCNEQIKIRNISSKWGCNISKPTKFCHNEMLADLPSELGTSSCCHENIYLLKDNMLKEKKRKVLPNYSLSSK